MRWYVNYPCILSLESSLKTCCVPKMFTTLENGSAEEVGKLSKKYVCFVQDHATVFKPSKCKRSNATQNRRNIQHWANSVEDFQKQYWEYQYQEPMRWLCHHFSCLTVFCSLGQATYLYSCINTFPYLSSERLRFASHLHASTAPRITRAVWTEITTQEATVPVQVALWHAISPTFSENSHLAFHSICILSVLPLTNTLLSHWQLARKIWK